jgi:hypothetical protein
LKIVNDGNSFKEITRALIDAKKLGHIKTDKVDECQVTTMQSDNLNVKIEFDSFKSVNSIKTEKPESRVVSEESPLGKARNYEAAVTKHLNKKKVLSRTCILS